ncbi:hypothetical protein AVEN_274147-1 [Araneus ventricosus]|uniref:Tc1-like transposase DDE domain-containing protein n=1 Tax=Araneus ventricosus TaxID=182803 RepID=A0A4Y2FYV4_ARAVE|nr:hypothetical protein AVEN_274147-1 [Araneus ventricosus]
MLLKKFDQMLIDQVQALLELRWSHRIIQTHFKMKGIAISLSHISSIKNSKLGSTKNDSKPITNGRQSKLKKSDLQRLEKMASKPDPRTHASVAKALNVSQKVNRRDLTPSTTVPHPKAVMVWMGISASGVTKPRFVQPGTKINSEYYIQKILKPFLKDDYCRLHPNGDAVFHQDSAPSHASRVTQKFLTDQHVQFLRPHNGCQTVLTLHHVTISYGDI